MPNSKNFVQQSLKKKNTTRWWQSKKHRWPLVSTYRKVNRAYSAFFSSEKSKNVTFCTFMYIQRNRKLCADIFQQYYKSLSRRENGGTQFTFGGILVSINIKKNLNQFHCPKKLTDCDMSCFQLQVGYQLLKFQINCSRLCDIGEEEE